eukprot:12407069-Karenia_brevis.AAC.1
MLSDIGYDDMGVVDYLVEGVKVVGHLGRTGIWKALERPALCSRESLWKNARESQAKLLQPRKPTKIDAVVWDKTLEEVGEGVLVGPVSSGEVESTVGRLWTGARRFGIEQSGKVRPIGDFS